MAAIIGATEGKDLEAYIYVPADRAAQVRQGLQVDLMDTAGKLLEKTSIGFKGTRVVRRPATTADNAAMMPAIVKAMPASVAA